MKKIVISLLGALLLVSSCEDSGGDSSSKAKEAEGLENSNGFILGIIGFNERLYEKELAVLSAENYSDYFSFIDNLEMNSGSVLYHAVNKSIKTLTETALPRDIVSVSVVTFTDGLDQGSYMLNQNQNSGSDYLQYVHERIKNDTVNGVEITAYAIGTRGYDVTDDFQFTQNLRNLSSSNQNALELNNVSDAKSSFEEIAASLTEITNNQILEFTFPAPDPGTKVRFTLDAVENASESEMYIEGVVDKAGSDFVLKNIVSIGVTSECDSVLHGSVSGINVSFAFEGFSIIDTQHSGELNAKHWNYIADNNSWQINSEFNDSENLETTIDNKSAIIILILDCSSSLGDDFDEMKEAAKSFIDVLLVEPVE